MNRRSFLALAPVAAIARVLPDAKLPGLLPLRPGEQVIYDQLRETIRLGGVTLDKMDCIDGIPLNGRRILLMGHPSARLNGIWEFNADGLYSRPTAPEC